MEHKVCNNIYMILRLGGELIKNQYVYYLYFLIDLLSRFNMVLEHGSFSGVEEIEITFYKS